MKKKVCFLVSTIFNLGGVQRCLTIIANALIDKGYEVSIVCTDNNYKIDYNLYGLNKKTKIKFIPVSIWEKLLFCWTFILKKILEKFLFLNKFISLTNFVYCKKRFIQNKKIINYLNQNNIDVCVGIGPEYTLFLGIYKDKLNCKIIGWQHSSFEAYFEKYFKSLTYWFKNNISVLDNYIVLNDYDKKRIKEAFNYEADCIYNPKSFYSNEKSKLNNKIFITVGRFSKVKGYERLIDSFNIFNQKNKDWKLIIIGEGELKDVLQEKINNNNLNDKILLIDRTNKVKDYYLNSSIYVLSSFHEGLPMVLIEACECGLPIISYDLPVCVEQFSDCSLIIEDGDINGFADAMDKLANDKKLLKDLANKAIINSKKYDIKNIIKKWEKIL